MAMRKDNLTLAQVIERDMDNAIEIMRAAYDFSDDEIFDEMVKTATPLEPFYLGMLERKLLGES